MSKSNAFASDVLRLVFNAAGIDGLADNAATDPFASLYVSLHSADPGTSGDQTVSEIAYGNYGRAAVARAATAWAVQDDGTVTAVAPIPFPPGTTGSGVATHFAIGVTPRGAGKLLYSGPLAVPQPFGAGLTPILATTTSISEA